MFSIFTILYLWDNLVTLELISLIPLVGFPEENPPSCEAPRQPTTYSCFYHFCLIFLFFSYKINLKKETHESVAQKHQLLSLAFDSIKIQVNGKSVISKSAVICHRTCPVFRLWKQVWPSNFHFSSDDLNPGHLSPFNHSNTSPKLLK